MIKTGKQEGKKKAPKDLKSEMKKNKAKQKKNKKEISGDIKKKKKKIKKKGKKTKGLLTFNVKEEYPVEEKKKDKKTESPLLPKEIIPDPIQPTIEEVVHLESKLVLPATVWPLNRLFDSRLPERFPVPEKIAQVMRVLYQNIPELNAF